MIGLACVTHGPRDWFPRDLQGAKYGKHLADALPQLRGSKPLE